MMPKAKLIMLAAIAASTAASAQKTYGGLSADQRLQLILRCNAVADQQARAVCYDEAAKAALAPDAAPAPEVAKPLAALPPPVRKAEMPAPVVVQAFGDDTIPKSRKVRDHASGLREIEGRLLSRTDDGTGYLVFNLDNGMSWQMTEKTEVALPNTGEMVTVRRSPLGAYMMDVGSRSAVRVVRLR
jgi:hypothetical protein